MSRLTIGKSYIDPDLYVPETHRCMHNTVPVPNATGYNGSIDQIPNEVGRAFDFINSNPVFILNNSICTTFHNKKKVIIFHADASEIPPPRILLLHFFEAFYEFLYLQQPCFFPQTDCQCHQSAE